MSARPEWLRTMQQAEALAERAEATRGHGDVMRAYAAGADVWRMAGVDLALADTEEKREWAAQHALKAIANHFAKKLPERDVCASCDRWDDVEHMHEADSGDRFCTACHDKAWQQARQAGASA